MVKGIDTNSHEDHDDSYRTHPLVPGDAGDNLVKGHPAQKGGQGERQLAAQVDVKDVQWVSPPM
jgi:hypothetical protein